LHYYIWIFYTKYENKRNIYLKINTNPKNDILLRFGCRVLTYYLLKNNKKCYTVIAVVVNAVEVVVVEVVGVNDTVVFVVIVDVGGVDVVLGDVYSDVVFVVVLGDVYSDVVFVVGSVDVDAVVCLLS
jgi:hypothetical protein